MVPFRNKGVMECTLMPMVQGLIRLARNSGELSTIEAHVVREKDEFVLEFGLEPKLKHIPYLKGDPGAMLFAYGVGVLKDGSKQSEVMTKAQIEHVRNKSKAKDQGPWVEDTEEMWRKTVAKRLCKYLPSSPELDRAIDEDDRAEIGEVSLAPVLSLVPNTVPGLQEAPQEDPKERKSRIINRLMERTREAGIYVRTKAFDECKRMRWDVTKIADLNEAQMSEWDSLIGEVESKTMSAEEFLTGKKPEIVMGVPPPAETQFCITPEQARVMVAIEPDLTANPPQAYFDGDSQEVMGL
jgi:hypothetical protein